MVSLVSLESSLAPKLPIRKTLQKIDLACKVLGGGGTLDTG
jgi:hypothetical protein